MKHLKLFENFKEKKLSIIKMIENNLKEIDYVYEGENRRMIVKSVESIELDKNKRLVINLKVNDKYGYNNVKIKVDENKDNTALFDNNKNIPISFDIKLNTKVWLARIREKYMEN